MIYVDVPERPRSDAPKIYVCAPTMSFAPKMKKIKRKDPKIIRVQKNLPPHILGGGGNHELGSSPDRDTQKNSLSKYLDRGPGSVHSYHSILVARALLILIQDE